jgi:hypothetical protein
MRINSSSLISSQVPEFIRSDYPTFVAFVEAYYEYLDQQGVDLKTVRDLDQTIDSFIDYFKKELAVNLPKGLQVDERFLLQHIKDQYLAKGSSGSFKLLFRLLYNKNVSLSYPGTQMLRASDGKWEQDVSIFVNVLIGTPDLIDGKLVDVIKPDRVFKVLIDRRQYVEVEINRIVQLSDNTYEFFIDRKFFGDIAVGDQIKYKDIFLGNIVSTTSKLNILERGAGFKAGQLFELKNGNGVRSIVKVTRVGAAGEIFSAEFIKFGIGYDTDFTVTLNATNDLYTSTNDSLLTNTVVTTGALSVTEIMLGHAEQGYINKIDYAYDIVSDVYQYPWDGTYAGETIREFSTKATSGIQVLTFANALLEIKLGSLTKYPGYYASNDGFLDDAIYIQDSNFYQVFSYALKIDERLASYKTAVKTMVHPAGMKLFGEFEIQNNFDISVALESLVKILAITLRSGTLLLDSSIHLDFSKFLEEEQFVVEAMTRVVGKSLSDSINTPEDYRTFTISKPLADSVTDVAESILVVLTKNLVDILETPFDSITVKDIGKALDDTLNTPTDSITSKDITKYLEDNTIGDFTQSGYVAINPYSSGGYFAITPIIYDNTIESTFS